MLSECQVWTLGQDCSIAIFHAAILLPCGARQSLRESVQIKLLIMIILMLMLTAVAKGPDGEGKIRSPIPRVPVAGIFIKTRVHSNR